MAAAAPDFPVDPETIDVEATDLPTKLAALCQRLAGKTDAAWAAVSAADLEVKPISGGITNMLYRISLNSGAATPGSTSHPPPVLARVFGKAGDVVCDRKSENSIFAELCKVGFGPKMFGAFGNGRLEGWLEGRRPLEPLEMLQIEPVDFVSLTAQRLADMHQNCRPASTANIWKQLQEWTVLAKEVTFPENTEKAEQLRKLDPFPRLEREVEAVEALVPSAKNGHGAALIERAEGADRRARELLYEELFCHMDLLCGNIMYSEEQEDVRLIDFEYAANCHVGLDVANHFCAVPESCLILEGRFDAERYYPSREVQMRWLKAYFGARGVEMDHELLTALLKVVLEFSLFAELRWVIWSVVQAGSSPVDFDYLDYGTMRLEKGYLQYKAWLEAGGRP